MADSFKCTEDTAYTLFQFVSFLPKLMTFVTDSGKSNSKKTEPVSDGCDSPIEFMAVTLELI